MRVPGWLGFRGKTLWDWLQLLIVPAILIGITFAWSELQTERDNELEEARIAADNTREDRRIDADRAAAEEARQDATLQTYLNQMSGLMLDKKLLSSKEEDEVRDVARTVTLATLRRLDGERKAEVVRFLYEAQLLDLRDPRVKLEGANLEGAELKGASLEGANLKAANLQDAELQSAHLEGANLKLASLGGAHLGGAHLGGADLKGARLAYASLERAKGLDLGEFISKLTPERAKLFLFAQKVFLDSLSPDELAEFNLSPEQLAKFRKRANGA